MHLIQPFRLLARLLVVALLGTLLAACQQDPARSRPSTEVRTITVTTLADKGKGSLRSALLKKGPRRIVFDVGGVIRVKDTLTISEPFVTIDGETAPSPGITLVGGRLAIKTHDVIVRHLRIRVGDGPGSDPENRDAILIYGNKRGEPRAYDILIEHCSLSWAIDEIVSVWSPGTHNVYIRNSIISEALSKSRHPKGEHSMGLIVGGDARDVVIARNLFAHNRARNPVVGAGSSAVIVNNLIYNPDNKAIHLYGNQKGDGTVEDAVKVSIVGNRVIPGPATRPGREGGGRLMLYDKRLNPGSEIYLKDNIGPFGDDLTPPDWLRLQPGFDPLVESPPIWDDSLAILPAAELEDALLDNVGARPWDRDAVDRRIIQEVRQRSGRIIDTPFEVGGLGPDEEEEQREEEE